MWSGSPDPLNAFYILIKRNTRQFYRSTDQEIRCTRHHEILLHAVLPATDCR